MRFFSVLTAIFFLLNSQSAQANEPQPQRLSAAEITRQLAGNTIIWNYDGLTQKQFIDSSGKTVFEHQNQEIEEGLWVVTQEGNFCSRWPTQSWTCYEILALGSTIYWSGPIGAKGDDESDQEVVISRLLRGNKTSFLMSHDQVDARLAALQN